jgi:hypothetical protein
MEHLIVKDLFALCWSTLHMPAGRPHAAPLTELVVLMPAITLGSVRCHF